MADEGDYQRRIDEEIWAALITPLTGDTVKDLRNLARDALSSVVMMCPTNEADPVTRNWLERAKYVGIYNGPTEGLIDDIINWIEAHAGDPDVDP